MELSNRLIFILQGDAVEEHVQEIIAGLAQPTGLNELLNAISRLPGLQVHVLNLIAIHAWQSGHQEHVLPLLQRAFHLEPDDMDTLYNLGYILLQLNQWRLAYDMLDRISDKDAEIVWLMTEAIKGERQGADLDTLPLVSILIPTCNRPDYFKLALHSALLQTYPHLEIVICDNSDGYETRDLLTPYLERFPYISYTKNPQNLGPIGNFHACYERAKGQYINYLMDDDLFHTEKVERMVRIFMEYPDVTLVTSFRQLIDEKGTPIEGSVKLCTSDTLMNGIAFADLTLCRLDNLIGEPTTAMFRKQDVETFGWYHGQQHEFTSDLVTWLHVLTKGNAVYLTDALSYFRIHQGQVSKQTEDRLKAMQAWDDILRNVRKDGFLANDEDYKQAVILCLNLCSWLLATSPPETYPLIVKYRLKEYAGGLIDLVMEGAE